MSGARPSLRILRTGAWLLAFLAAEVGLYLSYRGHDARFHWSTHFLVGASSALTVMTIVTRRRGTAVPAPLLWLLGAHLFAMLPDLAFAAGAVHRRWMDVFLGHVSAHFVPGRNWTWYAVFLATLASYLGSIGGADGRPAAELGAPRGSTPSTSPRCGPTATTR